MSKSKKYGAFLVQLLNGKCFLCLQGIACFVFES